MSWRLCRREELNHPSVEAVNIDELRNTSNDCAQKAKAGVITTDGLTYMCERVHAWIRRVFEQVNNELVKI